MSKKIRNTHDNQSVSFETDTIDLLDFTRASAHITVTNSSALISSITLQFSNDYNKWVDIPNASSSVTADNTVLFDVQTGASFVRAKVTISAGSASFKFDWVLK